MSQHLRKDKDSADAGGEQSQQDLREGEVGLLDRGRLNRDGGAEQRKDDQ
jgi:hypothetical protein